MSLMILIEYSRHKWDVVLWTLSVIGPQNQYMKPHNSWSTPKSCDQSKMATSSFQNKVNELERRLKAENKSRERDRARPHCDQAPRRPKPCMSRMFLLYIFENCRLINTYSWTTQVVTSWSLFVVQCILTALLYLWTKSGDFIMYLVDIRLLE